jgi:hypothetical protein
MNRWLLLSPALFLAVACGGTTLESSDAGVDGSADAAKDVSPSDSGPDTSGTYACGKLICQTGELCVHPCCGGAPPQCMPKEDGGTCPAGFVDDPSCNQGQGGCRPPPCTPPEPYCTSKPGQCGPPPSGRDVICLCG